MHLCACCFCHLYYYTSFLPHLDVFTALASFSTLFAFPSSLCFDTLPWSGSACYKLRQVLLYAGQCLVWCAIHTAVCSSFLGYLLALLCIALVLFCFLFCLSCKTLCCLLGYLAWLSGIFGLLCASTMTTSVVCFMALNSFIILTITFGHLCHLWIAYSSMDHTFFCCFITVPH